MTVLPESLLSPDDDWIEAVRRWLYPRLDTIWPMGSMLLDADGYVTTIHASPELVELELAHCEFVRNPVASFKIHPDGRKSVGSWVLLPPDAPDGTLEPDEQLHLTLVPTSNGGVDVFAHVETDWRDDPYGHLTDGGSYERADDLLHSLLTTNTYFDTTDGSPR